VPDTLSTFTQALGLVPDNTSRLIGPVSTRSVWLSLTTDRGGAQADPGQLPAVITIPAAGTWVDIPIDTGVFLPTTNPLFWRNDANAHVFYNYQADWPPANVPPGHIREVTMLAVVTIDPSGTGTHELAFSVSGVPIPPFVQFDPASQQNELTVTVNATSPIDVSAAPPISVQIRNLDSAGDVTLLGADFKVFGGALA